MIYLTLYKEISGTGSIYPLLLAFFYKHWPELLEQGRVLFCKTPMYISTNGKDTIWSYDEEEFLSKTFKGKWDHRYIKGLGSLTEKEYKKVVREPSFDVVEVDENSQQLFEMLFGESSELRKKWINGE